MIYVFFAPGFEEIEAITPVDLLRRAGLAVTTVGVGGRQVTGAHGITLTCDIAEADAQPDDLQMLVLPGGMPGTTNLAASPVVQRFIDHAAEQGSWLAAICAAPSVLGGRGLLRGRRATCFPGFEEQLIGATCTGSILEKDGNIITARGAGVAVDFALALVEALTDAQKAKQLAATLQCS